MGREMLMKAFLYDVKYSLEKKDDADVLASGAFSLLAEKELTQQDLKNRVHEHFYNSIDLPAVLKDADCVLKFDVSLSHNLETVVKLS